MENTAPVPITNEQALLIDELGVYLDTQRRQRRRLNGSGPLDYSNERHRGYVYQTKHCRLATGGVKIKTSVCAASRKETGCTGTIKVFVSADGDREVIEISQHSCDPELRHPPRGGRNGYPKDPRMQWVMSAYPPDIRL